MTNENKLTSDLRQFEEQLNGNNDAVQHQPDGEVQKKKLVRVRKNLVLAFPHGYSGCGQIRTIQPLYYMNTVFAKENRLRTVVTPVFISQKDILLRTSTLWFQRTMDPNQIKVVKMYKNLQNQLKYNMVYDIDDFVWEGNDKGESIPDYNFGRRGITDEVRKASVDIMNMMDTICVSSEFLGQYIKNTLGVTSNIEFIPNAIPNWFVGGFRKNPIEKRIEKPTIIYTGSPTHYGNSKNKLFGDWENAWYDYVVKNVKNDKINFIVMGGCPWFFEELKMYDNFTVINWLTSSQYFMPLIKYKADFSIGPLVPNYFNYSKSYIKMQEAYATGSVFIGTKFTNNKPSPYDIAQLQLSDNCTVEQIEEKINRCCEPEIYNSILTKQYQEMDENGWWLESSKYINKLAKLLVFNKSRWGIK